MKRIFELNFADLKNLDRQTLIDIIKNSEGRTVMAETVVSIPSLAEKVSNAELAAAFSADLITLNKFNCQYPFIFGMDDQDIEFNGNVAELAEKITKKAIRNSKDSEYVCALRYIIGRPIGVNLEPVPEGIPYPEAFKLNDENLEFILSQGMDYLVITANPSTGISEKDILDGIKKAREKAGKKLLIIAGKMHGAGTGDMVTDAFPENFIDSGADVVLIPAPGTVPGFDETLVKSIIDRVHKKGALAMTAIGTSQEGSSVSVIETIALKSKMCGADIHHIGDAGQSGMAIPENIMALSMAIRGRRHTYRKMGTSIRK